MLRDLQQVCERGSSGAPEDFRAAARALLARQFLLLERSRDREPYRLVANHFDYFTNLLDALGWTLHRDDPLGIIGVLPLETETHAPLRLVDTLLLLCLRLLYEEGVERFEVREGAVFTSAETLLGRYETLLTRTRPRRPELLEILNRLRRQSLLELGQEDENGLPMLRILPTIRLVTGSQVSERIRAFVEAARENEDDAEDGDAEGDDDAPLEDEALADDPDANAAGNADAAENDDRAQTQSAGAVADAATPWKRAPSA